MVIVLNSDAGKKEIEAVEKIYDNKKSSGGFNAKKFNGILKLTEDPLATQKKLRDEWERDITTKL